MTIWEEVRADLHRLHEKLDSGLPEKVKAAVGDAIAEAIREHEPQIEAALSRIGARIAEDLQKALTGTAPKAPGAAVAAELNSLAAKPAPQKPSAAP